MLVVLVASLLLVGGAVGVADAAENRTTHEHPDEVGEDGDVDEVAGWLSAALGGMLNEGAIEISESEYELARSLIGDEYDDRWEAYVQLDGETDVSAGESFEDAQNAQREYADTVERFEETYEEYEQAVEDGDEERARELFRELETLAEELQETNDRLVEAYDRIEEGTGVDLSAGRQAIEERTQWVNETTAGEDIEFDETRLHVESATKQISFSDPLTASGTVETVDGDRVDVGQVVLEIDGERRAATSVDAGSFDLAYRPVDLSLAAETATLRYEPPGASPYAGTDETILIEVVQVTPTLTIDEATANAGFDDEVAAAGSVTVDGEPIPDVPVVLSVGGEQLATTTTADDGTVSFAAELGPEPPAGEHELTLSIPLADRAIEDALAAEPVTVTETETTLSVTTQDDRVVGTLETADGIPIGDQSVDIYVDGERAETITTQSDGTLAVSADEVARAEEVTVTVRYDDPATNLGPSEASTTVAGMAPNGATATSPLRDLPLIGDDSVADASLHVLPILGAIAVLLLGSAYVIRRRGVDSIPFVGTPKPDPPVVTPSEEDTASPEPDDRTSPSWVALAEEHHAEGDPGQAIAVAYRAVRSALDDGTATGATHWEFLDRWRSTDVDGVSALERLTQLYERAIFAPTPVDGDQATDAIETATTVLSEHAIGSADRSETG